MVVFEKMWLDSGESGCIREKMVVFGQGGCNRGKWLSLGKYGFLRTKVILFGQSG